MDGSSFVNDPDGIVDMIIKIHRHKYSGLFSENQDSGYAYLGQADGQWSYEVDPVNQIDVYGGFPEYEPTGNLDDGSGFTITGNYTAKILDKKGLMGRIHHEYGHYFFGSNHSYYGKMGNGGEYFYDPWERIKLGYITPYTSAWNNYSETVVLDDYSARSSLGNHLLVVQMPYSEFIISNRRGVSVWDIPMAGDTNAFRETPHPEYGRGIYIYHNNIYSYPNYLIDIECADGQWKWEQDGYWAPDWDLNNAWLPLLKRTDVVYDKNDKGQPELTTNGSYAWGKDDLDILGLTTNQELTASGKWFSVGKNGTKGTDRLYTNENSHWTSRSLIGDRWDAWDKGYNEVFSPYSSPNTRAWNDENYGVFVWLYDYNTSTKQATFKIYKEQYPYGEGEDLDDILEATPPSKPMGIVEAECVYSNGYYRPKIEWNHNLEPDMERLSLSEVYFKRYKIYRSTYEDMSESPPDAYRYPENVYDYIATVDVPSNTNPSYVDNSLISACYIPDGQCPPNCWIQYPIRYRVQAIDKYNDESVLSDFVNVTGIRTQTGGPGGGEEDNNGITLNNEVPFEYALKQNYPNPFNPTTNIQFDLPKDGFVTLKIYDISGREVATLVNEFRNAGSYLAGFNASHLSSGVYFFTIKAGSFEETKRMVLIK